MALLDVSGLKTQFYTEEGVVRAVNGISYQIEPGEKFGIVGESGAGKSVASLSIMGLIETPGRIADGSIRFCEPETVQRFVENYPERTVDVDELQADHTVEDLVEQLFRSGTDPADLTDDERYRNRPPEDIDITAMIRDGAVDMRDLIDRGYAAQLGLIDDAFVVQNGPDGSGGYIDLTKAPRSALREIRGNEISMIFQDPQTALNPVYSVGEQVSEAIHTHMDLDKTSVEDRAIEMLERVGIPDAADRYSEYPHQFSGGMQQRVVIAIALSCDPSLVIADEPTTALDVTIEAQIIELLEELSDEFDTAIQLITHDLGVVAGVCDRVAVMYAGEFVEHAPIEELYYAPKHPYTVGLMGSIPRIGDNRERLDTIPGMMPDLVDIPPGCSFHPRCPYAEEICTRKKPPLIDTNTDTSTDTDTDIDTNTELGTSPSKRDIDTHTAACLEYTGDLEEGLDFEVHIAETDELPVEEPNS